MVAGFRFPPRLLRRRDGSQTLNAELSWQVRIEEREKNRRDIKENYDIDRVNFHCLISRKDNKNSGQNPLLDAHLTM